MPECQSIDEVYAFVMEREVKACVLFRFAAQSAEERDAKALLERLYQRGEAYLEKLTRSRKSGRFQAKPCTLADSAYYKTIREAPAQPGQRIPQILIFAIKSKHDDYLLCHEGARRSQHPQVKRLWLALAEEKRRQRLELESYYEKEVIGKI